MLNQLKSVAQEIQYGSDSPVVACEACDKKGYTHDMINFLVGVGSTGKAAQKGFQCPGGGQTRSPEHWACSPECWSKVAHACIDEHMLQMLKDIRSGSFLS